MFRTTLLRSPRVITQLMATLSKAVQSCARRVFRLLHGWQLHRHARVQAHGMTQQAVPSRRAASAGLQAADRKFLRRFLVVPLRFCLPRGLEPRMRLLQSLGTRVVPILRRKSRTSRDLGCATLGEALIRLQQRALTRGEPLRSQGSPGAKTSGRAVTSFTVRLGADVQLLQVVGQSIIALMLERRCCRSLHLRRVFPSPWLQPCSALLLAMMFQHCMMRSIAFGVWLWRCMRVSEITILLDVTDLWTAFLVVGVELQLACRIAVSRRAVVPIPCAEYRLCGKGTTPLLVHRAR
mmetsp:Transcript_859/g.1921  ORF Transcript_859/g.1921 Transcript_859/m.1921 type:complete len:294 (-) Transcript_859:88-969(-)